MKNLSRTVLLALFAVLMLSACIVPSRHGRVDVLLPPPLPVFVEIGPDRHYHRDGHDYYYEDNRWRYSRDGHRYDLPSSHYPREIKRRGDWR